MEPYVLANAEFSKFSRNYMELKKGLPIRPSEMGVLNILTQTAGPHTPMMLAECLGVSKPMVTAHLSALSDGGYIRRESSVTDKRVCYVLPTQKAWELVSQTQVETNRQLAMLEEKLGAEDFSTLVTLLQKTNLILERKKEA